jgi:serine/threonine protein kinase
MWTKSFRTRRGAPSPGFNPRGSTVSDVLERLRSALSDRYRIERELGSGGMATVYLAEDLKHHRKVAVKVLPLERSRSLLDSTIHTSSC